MKRFLASTCFAALAAPLFAQTKMESLATLIQTGQRKAALERIRAGSDVNEAQPDGTRPIHWAVYKVDYELVQALLAKKARADVSNEFGSTPIAEAAKLADARLVKMLLDAGAGVEGANSDGQTALMLAIKTGELPIVEMLINAGANVNNVEKFHNQTPLMWAAAASRNAGEMVKLLLSKGADTKPRALFSDWDSQITSEPRAQYRPTGGLTALLYAARNGCGSCVEALAAAGADVNVPTPEGVTALMLALDNDHNDTAKVLLDRGANPNVWDWWGRTALYIVVDRKEVVAAPTGRGGRGAAPVRTSQGVSHMDIINALLAVGVDPNPQMNMHRPSRGGNSGRFIDPLLNTGCTPLLRATMAQDIEVARVLLAKGASPNINAMGLTPFLVAAGTGTGGTRGTGLAQAAAAGGPANNAMMDVMIQHGADLNSRVTGTKSYSGRIARAPSTNEGMTALHSAAQSGRTEVVRYLLEKGANPDLLDGEGRKPIDLVSTAATRPGAPAPAGAAPRAAGPPPSSAEIRTLLQNAMAKK